MWALEEMQASELPALMAPLADHPLTMIRQQVAEVLGRMISYDQIATLSKLALDAQPRVRSAVAVALGAYDDPESNLTLSTLRKDEDADVCRRARKALKLRRQRSKDAHQSD